MSLAVLCAVLAVSAVAQDLDDVGISGRVTDTNGEAVPGATVTAKQVQTGLSRSVTTNASGRYQLIELPPGTYTIRFEAQGFGAKERIDLVTVSGQNLQLDMQLSPADVQAEATVTVDDDDAPAIDTTRVIVGSTLSEREIEELPNNLRNPLDLVMTLGGVSEEALSTSDLADDRNADPRGAPFEQGNFSLSGGASYSNNITIDGMDNNDDRAARDRFQPSIEAVAEVQVIRNQFSAEYGRASGGRVNIRTRSGTNRYRLQAYMFYKNAKFNANTWYNNSRGIERLPMEDINPGVTFSGPIQFPFYNGKNKTFFSLSYELQQLNDTTLIDTFIPIIPNPRFDLPAPNGSGTFCDQPGSPPPPCTTGGEIGHYTLQYATPNTGHIVSAKVDHKITGNNNLTVGFQFGRRTNRRTRGASTTRLEEALQARNIETEAINVTNNHVFGPSVVNQARFQWSSYRPSFQTDNPGESVVLIGYRNPITNSVQTLISGNSSASSNIGFADNRDESRIQVQDSLTYITGSHSLKFGADVQYVDSKANNLADGTGTFNFNNVLNYSNNVVTRFRQNFGTRTDVTNTYWGFFVNDEWRVKPNLSVTMGVRYEKENAVSDNNNFGPRLGIAWDPTKKGRDVIRFGAGIFYNRVLLRTVGEFIQNRRGGMVAFDTNTIPTSGNWRNNILATITQHFPEGYATIEDLRTAISSTTCGSGPCSPNLGFAENATLGGIPLRTVEPGLKIPESYQFNVGYEREVAKNWVFEVNYSWNKTAHLWREYNSNLPVLPSGYDEFVDYLLDNPFVFTNFNGTTRTYQFYLGPSNDPSGISTNPSTQTGTCGTTVNVVCWINLNTFNTSTAVPNTNASDGVSTNTHGGAIGIAREALRHLRPVPEVDAMERVASLGKAFYHGVVIEFRRRYRSIGKGFGFSMRSAYTLSRTMDDGLNNTSNAEVNDDFGREWARARQDRLHRFALSGTFDTPRWMGKLRFSPVFRYGSASVFNLGYGIDRNLNNQSTDRVLFSGDLSELKWRRPGQAQEPTALLAKFSLQPIGARSGNIPRNAGIGPSQYIFDLGVTREFRFGERMRLRPTVQFGNILNMAVFSFGAEFIDFIGTGDSPTQAQLLARRNFLVPTRTYRQRDMRFGLRFNF
ncbi:MAG: TonB-dependent receptor [Acidobacteria bacterium]|nr:TonB-dependent receptor [Acidobacteriota bacterium]